jgi:hypothetical protein
MYVAWENTVDIRGCISAMPQELGGWILYTAKGSPTRFHFDYNGVGTFVHILTGEKLWALV